jgi:hypothetical protein
VSDEAQEATRKALIQSVDAGLADGVRDAVEALRLACNRARDAGLTVSMRGATEVVGCPELFIRDGRGFLTDVRISRTEQL